MGAGSPIDYTAVTFLVIAASLIGASRRISPWSSWNETPILWACLVGSPSSNKSPGADPVLQILRELETEMALDYPRVLREWTTQCETARHVKEAWQKDVRTAVGLGNPPPVMPATAEEPDQPQRPRLIVSDVTPEKLGELLVSNQRGLLCHRDEFAGWFNSFGRYSGMGGAERAFWLECYGGRSYSIDRIKSPAPIVIPYLAVSLLGGTQPDRLTDLLNSPDDGLQARMLWVFPDKVPRRRPTCDISSELPTRALRRLAGLSFTIDDDGQSRPVICRLDDSAAQNFEAWWCEHGKVELSGLLGSIHGKAPGLVLRLALVLAHLRWAAGPETVPPPNSIDASTVDAAIVLATDYFQPMAKRVLCEAELPENERLAMILGRWIQENQPRMINAREIRRNAKLPGLREAANMDKACEELCNAGWLRPVPTRAGSTAGRPRKDFEVNPKVLTNHKA